MTASSREMPVDPAHAGLLIIDVQNYCAHREGGAWRGLDDAAFAQRGGYLFRALREAVLPNLARLLAASRTAGIEVIYTVIENLTRDGRDRSLDYKISGIDVPPGSFDAQIPAEIAPAADEIVLRKTSSDAFVSTNLDYLLRNRARADYWRAADRSVRRKRGPPRLRSGLSGDACQRCLRRLEPRAA
jgi:ureidoacrylate peracid hydrolase